MNIWINTIVSAVAVSLIAFMGIFLLLIKDKIIKKILLWLIAFAFGAMLGNCIFHLLPESFENIENKILAISLIISGFVIFFIIDKIINTQSNKFTNRNIANYGYLCLYSDGVHNFTDGVLIAVSWLASSKIGFAVTLSIIFHEIPHEIGNLGVLLKAGFAKKKALLFNFYSACTAILGAVITLAVGETVSNFAIYIIPVAAGSFIYLALLNLLPEIVRSAKGKQFLISLVFTILGMILMYLL